MPAPQKPDYGIDAPGVLRGFLYAALTCFLSSALMAHFIHPTPVGHLHLGAVTLDFPVVSMVRIFGIIFAAEFVLYLIYVKAGKFRHRDRMLSIHQWRGDELSLDVGCGRGLLLVAAAKLSPRGHATGIDIWSNTDMGGNSSAATQRNIDLESVTALCDLQSMPAQAMTFPDNTFDVVLSNLCIHNIAKSADRDAACREIVRVLKPGGVALISDYKNIRHYQRVFAATGSTVRRHWLNYFATFPPLSILEVRKPQ
jgi:SAM-dependent methyltransferase